MPMPSLPAPEIPLPGEFVGPQLAATPERWTLELEPLVRNELARVLAALARGDDEAPLVVATHAALERVTARVLALLGEGPGFALVRGVPVEGHSRDVVSAARCRASIRAVASAGERDLDPCASAQASSQSSA